MKLRAVLAILLVIGTGFVRFCPACEEASLREHTAARQPASAHSRLAHACCQKESQAEPQSIPPSGDPERSDCGREQVTQILRVAIPEGSISPNSVPVDVLVVAVAPEGVGSAYEGVLSPWMNVRADSPPIPLVSLPIRI